MQVDIIGWAPVCVHAILYLASYQWRYGMIPLTYEDGLYVAKLQFTWFSEPFCLAAKKKKLLMQTWLCFFDFYFQLAFSYSQIVNYLIYHLAQNANCHFFEVQKEAKKDWR